MQTWISKVEVIMIKEVAMIQGIIQTRTKMKTKIQF